MERRGRLIDFAVIRVNDASTVYRKAVTLVFIYITHRSIGDAARQARVLGGCPRNAPETVDRRIVPPVDYHNRTRSAVSYRFERSIHGRLVEFPPALVSLRVMAWPTIFPQGIN